MDWISQEAEQQYAAVVRSADRLLVGLDFDGTLSPIVADPEAAAIHDRAPEVLLSLADRVQAIAVVTGRPARQVVALGGFEALGDGLREAGRELIVLGQYGNQRWTSERRDVVSPPPPEGLSALMAELPRLLDQADAPDAWIEEKGLAVAVHTRRLADDDAAFKRLMPVLCDAAPRHGLAVGPGRSVVEIRDPGMDKGVAVESLVRELDVLAAVFVGDDLGDIPAFEALRRLRRDDADFAAVLVCSGSTEQRALVQVADVVVPGPDGVMAFLERLGEDIAASGV